MKLRTISALISSAPALLLLSPDAALAAQGAASDAALAAQEDAPKSIDLTYTVSTYGWRNLRRIESSIEGIPTEYWYVCGSRKILGLPKKNNLDYDNFELIDRAPHKEFGGDDYEIVELDQFGIYSKNRKNFLATAVSACATVPKAYYPELFSLGFSAQASGATFYYLLEKDFQAYGKIRAFWMNGHPARKDKMKIRPSSKLFKIYQDNIDTLGDYLVGADSWWVSEKRNIVARIEINCASSEIRTINQLEYNTDGSVIFKQDHPEKFETIFPGSIADSWREAVCLIK